jgi:phosphate transport system permease protein
MQDLSEEVSSSLGGGYSLEPLPESGFQARKYKNLIVYGFCLACVAIAVVPLVSILVEVIINGAPAITPEFLTSGPGVIGQAGGGIGNAIQGTLILMGLASAAGIPIGVLAGIYLAEFGEVDVLGSPILTRINRTLSGSLRFLNNVLAEFPSIVIGIFAYSIVVLALRSFSTIAGATALAIIMLPTVTRTTEESIKLVPGTIRDAAAALGIPKWRATLSVVLSTSRSGVITGVLLAVARIAGETAPLILTVLGSSLFFNCFSADSCVYSLTHPVDALPLRIWRLALLPYDYARQQGWGAALVLIMIVLVVNVTVRFATRGKYSAMRLRQ